LDQPARDRILARHAELVVVLMRQQETAVVPARILELAVIDADLGAARAGMEAQHDRGGKGPGLRRVIAHLVDAHRRFLLDLARHRFLEALARLDESGERRMHAGGPDALAPQEAALAIMDQ